MTQHDDGPYLGQLLDAAIEARGYTEGITFDEFALDKMRQRAVVYVIQTIGESARRVSPEGKTRLSYIPWSMIIGMGHKIVHDYLDIDIHRVWETATVNLPELLEVLPRALEDLGVDDLGQ